MIEKFFVYCLYSDKYKQLYIGHTNNMERRFSEHNLGKVMATKAYIPYRLIYTEEFSTKKEAVIREKNLKLTQGRRFLKNLII
jgi:putative endonuclease